MLTNILFIRIYAAFSYSIKQGFVVSINVFIFVQFFCVSKKMHHICLFKCHIKYNVYLRANWKSSCIHTNRHLKVKCLHVRSRSALFASVTLAKKTVFMLKLEALTNHCCIL